MSVSSKTSNCDRSMFLPELHGCSSFRQCIGSFCNPSIERFNAHHVKDFLMMSIDSSAHASMIHCKRVLLGGASRSLLRFFYMFSCCTQPFVNTFFRLILRRRIYEKDNCDANPGAALFNFLCRHCGAHSSKYSTLTLSLI